MSLKVESGKVTGFLGANGAGKSTTIKSILGLLIKDQGEVTFFEEGPLSPSIKKRIGFLPERPFFYEYLNGTEFLEFYARLTGMSTGKSLNKRIEELLELVGLSHAKGKKLRDYSKGMLQRVGIAQAIIHDPDLIIFDEPMSGLDPDGRYEVGSILQQIADQGKTVFFSSHLLHDVERLSDDLVILKKGKLIYEGQVEPLLKEASSKFVVSFLQGERRATEELEDSEKLQLRLDELRGQGANIIAVRPQKVSLEDAYVKLNQ